jgi:hypothetical protein
MGLPLLPIGGLLDANISRRIRETINNILSFAFDDSRIRTPAEVAAGVTPVNYAYPPGDVRRYGVVGDGVANDTAAFAAAFSVGGVVTVPQGTFLVDGDTLSITRAGLRLEGVSEYQTIIRRRTNGVILNINAHTVTVQNISFRGEDSTPVLTGDNITISDDANNVTLERVDSRETLGSCVNAARCSYLTIRNCFFDNAAATAGTPGVIWGRTGLTDYIYYGVIDGIVQQPSGNPVRIIGGATHAIVNSQIGGLQLQAGTFGTASNRVVGNRILGDVTIDGAGQVFTGNAIGGHQITFNAGSSSGRWVSNSESLAPPATFVNNGNANNFIMREVSSGSTIKVKYGPDSSLVELTYDPATGVFSTPAGVTIPNATNFQLTSSSGSSSAVMQLSASDNLALSNSVSGKAVQIAQAGAGIVQWLVNGTTSVQADASTTAGNTRLLVYDVDNGTLERVTVGAADSGGVGFKVLRIPN